MNRRKKRSKKVEPKKKISDKIPFQAWLQQKIVQGKLNTWQQREISVFFKEKGLSNAEPQEKYDEMLKKY